MSQTEATRQRDYESPIMVDSTGKAAAAVLAATATVASLDLTTVPALPATYPAAARASNTCPLGHYVTIHNDGPNDAYIAFGPTTGSVTGANAPNPATTGTNAVGLCMRIPSGSEKRLKLPVGDMASATGIGGDSPARWLGYICKAAQTATLRVYQSSP